jgi:hypothetical protein
MDKPLGRDAEFQLKGISETPMRMAMAYWELLSLCSVGVTYESTHISELGPRCR